MNSKIFFLFLCVSFFGVGVNFKPFSSSFCSASVNFFLDKLIICIVLLVAIKFGARVLEIVDCPGIKNNLDTHLCSEFGPVALHF